jgi:hypothetical protein
MINSILPSNRNLEKVLKDRKVCRDEFRKTAKKVNGHAKKMVESTHADTLPNAH